jgi:formiminoglutamate deiminase
MTTFWCEQAWIDDRPRAGVRLDVRDGRFDRVQTGTSPRRGDIKLPGLTLPGFANAHSHTFHRALRGLAGTGSSFWAWREHMYRVADALTPDTLYELARLSYREMLAAGYTTVGEFHYVHGRPDGTPYADPNAMGSALIAAAADAGIRITLLDTLYLSAGFGAPLEPAQARFDDRDVDAWIDRISRLSDTPGSRIGAAAHSIRAVSPAAAGRLAAWCREAGRPIHVHLSEQPQENERCAAALGTTPAQALAEVGFWGADTTAVHATHLTAADIALLGAARTTIAICPSTEADLADGIPALPELQGAGAAIALGSDQNVLSDGLREAQSLETSLRLSRGTRENLTPADLVTALTRSGQHSLGWDDATGLRPGALADFVTLRLDGLRTAGCALTEIPRVATADDLTSVHVGGADRTPDEPAAIAAELDALCRRLRGEDRTPPRGGPR